MITFQEFVKTLIESPEMDYNTRPEDLHQFTYKKYKDYINANRDKVEPIKGDLKKLSNGDNVFYFRDKGDGDIGSYSYVQNGVHNVTSKNGDADSSNIHEFMKHHVDNHDSLDSYESNTKGSKKLWKDLIKNNDGRYDFHVIDNGVKTNKLDSKNISAMESHIWGDGENPYSRRIVRMSKINGT